MEAKQRERIWCLMGLLKKTDRIHLKDITRMLEVPVTTVRHNPHQEDGLLSLILLGGYIVMVDKPAPSMLVIHDVPKNHRNDLPIATLVAGVANENDLIFLDNGQEIPPVISTIPDAIILTGVCYPYRIFVTLNRKPNVTAIPRGGTYHVRNDAFYDASNSSPLDSPSPREIFISVSDVHNHFGISRFNPGDPVTRCEAVNRGLRRILLVRHALFDEAAFASLAPISIFDAPISGRPLPADYIIHCQNGSVKIITPDLEDG